MHRRFAWLGAVVGALAFWRWFRRRPEPRPVPAPDPADELRARLEQSRAAVVEPGPATPEVADEPDADARRRAVHEQARARMDELRGDGAD